MEMNRYQAGISDFTDSDSIVFGISADKLEDTKKVATDLGLDFALLSDVDAKVINQYGGTMEQYAGLAKRVTYVVGKDGRIAYIAEGGDAMDPAGAKAACQGLE